MPCGISLCVAVAVFVVGAACNEWWSKGKAPGHLCFFACKPP